MSYHCFAVLGPVVARAPQGLESAETIATAHPPHPDAAELERHEAACKSLLDLHPTREKVLLGKGSGFGFDKNPYCSYAQKEGVHIIFSGEVAEWPGINAVSAAHDAFMQSAPPLEADDAHFLLDFYSTFSTPTKAVHDNDEILQRALDCLAAIKGSFAFVIYDAVHHRVLAARDPDGTQPFYWGATALGQLMFGTVLGDLEQCDPTATIFPAGTLFSSVRPTVVQPGQWGWMIEGDEMPGELLSFVKVDAEHYATVKGIPRITSKGMVQGAVYKVSSQPDLEHTVNHY